MATVNVNALIATIAQGGTLDNERINYASESHANQIASMLEKRFPNQLELDVYPRLGSTEYVLCVSTKTR